MGKTKYALSIVLSFMLTFCIVLLIITAVLLNTLFSDKYHVEQIDKSGFTPLALNELRETYVSHGAASGIPSEVMEKGVTPEQIISAAKSSLRSAFHTGSAFDYARYTNELLALLREYADSMGIEPAPELDEGLEDLARLCAGEFKAHTDSELYRMLARIVLSFKRYLGMALTFLIAASAVIAVTLMLLNNRLSRLSEYGVYVFGANTIICALIPWIVKVSGVTERLNITPRSFNRLFTSVLDGFFNGFIYALLPASFMLVICAAVKASRMRNKSRRRVSVKREG
ncbi:MAG: hypothetical protein FWH06_01350 [Oscillospiraceae bacterium]|nr:hypothetical protein [Oscillospiraceae bacterium]